MDCFSIILFISVWVKLLKLLIVFLYIAYIVVILHIDFIVLLLSIMSGDIELNPGIVNGRNRQCCVLYSNI